MTYSTVVGNIPAFVVHIRMESPASPVDEDDPLPAEDEPVDEGAVDDERTGVDPEEDD